MSYKRISPQPVIEGGTGQASLTNHGLLVGAGTSGITQLGVAATGSGLMGISGADPAFTGSPSFSGSVTAGTGLTVTTGDATISGGNLLLPVTSATQGAVKINGSLFLHMGNNTAGLNGTFVGPSAGNTTLTGIDNTCVGAAAGAALTTGLQNVALGESALNLCTQGQNNTALGDRSLNGITTGNNNTFVGALTSAQNTFNGSNNIVLNAGSLSVLYNTTEGSNILIGHAGVAAENNTIHIGTNGTGTKQQNVTILHGGNVTKPNSAAFMYFLGTTDSNVTGDGTIYTLGSGNALTKQFEQGSNFVASTGIFTAPVDGVYSFYGQVWASVAAIGTVHYCSIVTSARTVRGTRFGTGASDNLGGYIGFSCSLLVALTAGQTASFQFVSANGTKTISVLGDATTPECFFQGMLVA